MTHPLSTETSEPLRSDLSVQIRLAAEGDASGIARVVRHFTPELERRVARMLDRRLRSRWEPLDLVQDAWVAMLPQLRRLVPRNGRITPALRAFLRTVITRRHTELLRRHHLDPTARADAPDSAAPDPRAPAEAATHRELRGQIWECVAELSADDARIVRLFYRHHLSYAEIESVTGISRATLHVRLHRARARMRERLLERIGPDALSR